jgi:hypothetical protein
MPSSGLTLTDQAPISAPTLTLDGRPLTDITRDALEDSAFRRAILEALRSFVEGETPRDAADRLREHVTDHTGIIASAVRALEYGDQVGAWRFVAGLRSRGHGTSELGDVFAVPDLFAQAEPALTLAVEIQSEFREMRRDQREDLLAYLAALAEGCDVHLVCTTLTQRWLAQTHRSDLPGVSEHCNTTPDVGPVAERVETALGSLDPDGRRVQVLRDLNNESSGSLQYKALYALHEVTDGRIRGIIGDLKDLGLVGTPGPADTRTAELLDAGRIYLEKLDELVGTQSKLEGNWTNGVPGGPPKTGHSSHSPEAEPGVSEALHLSDDSRVTPHAHVAPQEGGEEQGGATTKPAATSDRHRLPYVHHVKPRSRWQAAGAWASAPENGMAVVDYPFAEADDQGEPGWYYLKSKDALVVSAEYTGPLQHWVCVARALASERTFRRVLPEERFDDDDELENLLGEYRSVLRETRCLGYLPDEIEDADGYIDALRDAEDGLCELTKRWHHNDYEMTDEAFRSLITREAIGLAMTMTHLLDMAGVEVVREVRVPEFSKNFDADRQDELAESLAVGAAIGSRYDQFAGYRQLYEQRESKQRWSYPPTVDADAPMGELIGRVTVVGSFGEQQKAFKDRLAEALADPRPLREDAPEFGIEVPVTTDVGREAYARAASHILSDQKGMRLTREAVSALRVFLGSPYDVTRALQNLGHEDWAREIRLDEVRFGLAHLPADRICPWFDRSAQKLVHALLTSMEACSVADLCERAGVSRSTWYRHKDELLALDLVRETEQGYRIALPHHGGSGDESTHERHETILPWWAHIEKNASEWVIDVVEEVVDHLISDPTRLLTPGDPVREAVGPVPEERDLGRLAEEWPWMRGFIGVLRDVLALDLDEPGVPTIEASTRRPMMGTQPAQASLQATATTDANT